MRLLATYIACLLTFLALDAVWLGVVSPAIYARVLSGLLLDGFRPVPAILFYLLYIAGIVVFVVPLGRRSNSLIAAVGYGAFFGVCAYGTYDLTNHAVLKVWTTELTVIDMAWGAVVTAAASTAGVAVDRKLRRTA